jgi:hypothetical protein
VVASGFDLLIIGRYNKALGVSDKVFYMLGDAVIAPAIGMFFITSFTTHYYYLYYYLY